MGRGMMDQKRLVAFFMENNPSADREKVSRMARYYAEEGRTEGVNADVAYIQMCLETGFLRFGGLVTEDMNNFCGLGSIGPGQPGNRFPDERTGVRAHIQHLKAYGSREALSGIPVDPRYKYVNPKGKAPTIDGLAGTWAADRDYGSKLARLLTRLYGL
jgi:Mannosyl-glycoprotein endo-beta-N-acetylglucosaminidase.